nr:MAG TPA: Prokaryotic membrane lipoprotein lipid attachment site [Caudoviricetes sp.]
MKKLLVVLFGCMLLTGCANEVGGNITSVKNTVKNDIESYLISEVSLAKNGYEFAVETLDNGDIIVNVVFTGNNDNFFDGEYSVSGLKNMYNNLSESAKYATDEFLELYPRALEKDPYVKVIFKYDSMDSNGVLLSEIVK